MANPKINGTLSPVPQTPEVRYDPTRGIWYRLAWESAGDNLESIALQCQAARVGYEHTKSGHKSRLIAEAGGSQLGYQDVLADNWQILANEIQKDVREHPFALAMEESAAGMIGKVENDVTLYNQGKGSGDPDWIDISGNASAVLLFNMLVRGTTHYALGQYVLRHTTSVSQGYAANISDLNVEKTYTTTQLLAEVTNGALWIYPLPPRLVYKLQNIAAPAARTNYLWGWRKLPSTEVTAAGNRIEISTEYWLEQWHTTLYPAVT